MGFNDAHLFAQHINSLHSLPVFEPEYQTKDATAETAFNGALQFHEIMNNAACRVLESFMLNQRSAIATLIKQRLSQEPQKVQFTVKLQFLKLHQDESSTELGESIKIFALLWRSFTLTLSRTSCTEMAGTIILTKHPHQYNSERTFTNLWAILKYQWDLSKWKPLRASMMWQLTSLVTTKDSFTIYEFPLLKQILLLIFYFIMMPTFITVLITDLVKIVCKIRDVKFRFGYRIWRNCVWLCRDGLEIFYIHTENCCLTAPAVIQMLSPNENMQVFKFFRHLVCSFGDIFRFQFFFCDPSLKVMHQLTNLLLAWLKKLEPCGFALAVVNHLSSFEYTLFESCG